MFRVRFDRLAALLAAGLVLTFGNLAASQGPRPGTALPHRPWAQEVSDLKPDPAVIFGTLPNGVKYAVKRNQFPGGQLALRLVIDAGNMHERRDQAGLAHFIEHMAFRGSAKIPDGQVRATLERLGLRYGRDINAATEGVETRYKFNLARNDEAILDTGLGMLREIAGELSFDPAAVESERGVVLAELRAKRGPQLDLLEALAAWQLGDHPFARGPGGDPAVVQRATPADLRAFYDAYYRPERATVVVVGDFDPDEAVQKIRRVFSTWRAKGPAGGDPPPLSRAPVGPRVSVITLPGVSNDGLEELFFHPYSRPDLTATGERQRLVRRVGEVAMRLRLRRMLEPDVQPFETVDGLYTADVGQVAAGDIVSLAYLRNVPESLAFQVMARRQVAEHGVTREEVVDTVAFLRSALDVEISQGTLRSSQIADELSDGADTVYLDGDQRRAGFERAAGSMSLAEINAALKDRMSGESRLLYYGAAPPPGGEAALASLLAAAEAKPAPAYVTPPVKPWTFTDFGPPGRVVERRTDGSLGVTMVRFENGVRLTIKPTGYVKNEVQVKVRFGSGQLGMPRDALGPSDFGFMMFYDGGLKGYTETELSRTLSGKRVAAVPFQTEDAFELTSSTNLATPPDQLELELQRLAAPFSAAAYRPDHWAGSLRVNAENERADAFTPDGVYGRNVPSLLRSGDVRWVFSTAAMQATWKPQDAADWIKPIVDQGPLEVIVVGEVANVQRAIDAAARTFGALPPRPDRPELPGAREVRFPAPTPTPVELRHKGPADQAMVVIAWPGTDALANTRQTQAANLLSLILTNRLLDELRTRQARTYSPAVAEAFSRTVPGYGYLSVRITVRPEDAAEVLATIDRVAADLAAREVSTDEFNRAKNPRLEYLMRAFYSDSQWMLHLSGVQTDPRLASLFFNARSDTASLTRADIHAAAARWLVKDKSWRAVILPEPGAPEGAVVTSSP